jgi:hydrophobic/amphiphilic exporter-1 (mainly G- bacteria), HAE1 family
LIGLAAKNAILVVEFANQLHEQGMSYVRAAVKAGEERLRPILNDFVCGIIGIFTVGAVRRSGRK